MKIINITCDWCWEDKPSDVPDEQWGCITWTTPDTRIEMALDICPKCIKRARQLRIRPEEDMPE